MVASLGGGGVGSIAIQIAKKVFNLEVIATASRPETMEWCKHLGADHVIDHSKDLVEQIKALGFSKGVPYIFCTVDSNLYWSLFLQTFPSLSFSADFC